LDISNITKYNLDEFISWVDNNGGPESLSRPEITSKFKYTTDIELDDSIDPNSEDYLNFQLEVYKELSNRDIDQQLNEQTNFNIGPHITSNNPYNINDPSNFVFHYLRLGHTVKQANMDKNPKLLDMGCGWGLSTEFLGTLGATVTAVDINPDFISLINARSEQNVFDIKTVNSSFTDYFTTEKFDGILFYECLHHAIDIGELINKLKFFLKPGGVIMLAGEPIQSFYWNSWGMRLDALSIYCIRKFGWFESGWSEGFLKQKFVSLGFDFDMAKHDDPLIGYTVVAKHITNIKHIPSIVELIDHTGWFFETDFLVSSGVAKISKIKSLLSKYDDKNKSVVLSIFNFSSIDIKCELIAGDHTRTLIFKPNHNTLELTNNEIAEDEILFKSDVWCPSELLENSSDNRIMSFHLFAVEII